MSVGVFAPWGYIYGSFNSLVGCTGSFSSCLSVAPATEGIAAAISSGRNSSLTLVDGNGFAEGISSTGSPLWLGTEGIRAGFADAAGTFYYWNPSTNEVVAMNGLTGSSYWRQNFTSSISAMLLGDDGCIYVQTGTGISKGCR